MLTLVIGARHFEIIQTVQKQRLITLIMDFSTSWMSS